MAFERLSQQGFLAVSALLFAVSAALTTVWCASMSAMREMPMPGGWTMSMAWMRMPGQTWPGAAAPGLKLAGCPLTDDEAGPLTWGVWMDKN
jgi:hypothetical protein